VWIKVALFGLVKPHARSGFARARTDISLQLAMLRARANDAETSTGWGYDRRLWRMNLLMASAPGGWVACIGG
jgi:hypothetical protein